MKKIEIGLFLFFTLTFFSCNSQTPRPKHSMDTEKQPTNPYYSRTDTTPVHVSNEEWQKVLSPEVYEVARNKGTERAFTGQYWNTEEKGTYYCVACGNKLFRSDSKFASSCGWPSFFESIRPNAVIYKSDTSYGMIRTEVMCGRCEGHLGHIFDDGPPPSHKRFCMNSIVLDFEPDGQ